MEKKLMRLAQTDQEGLQCWLKEIKKQEISTLIGQSHKSKSFSTVQILKSLLQGLVNGANKLDQFESKRLHIFEEIVKLLKDNFEDIGNKQATEISSLLTLQADILPTDSLVHLVLFYCNHLKQGCEMNGRWADVFPKLLSCVSEKDAVEDTSCYPMAEVSGREFKDTVIERILSYKWNTKALVYFISTFREIALSKEQLKEIINQTFDYMKHLPYEEIPPVVYQLLLLSIKGQRKLIIENLANFFNNEDRNAKQKQKSMDIRLSQFEVVDIGNGIDDLHHIQGTVILHVTFAAKQDQQINKEIIRILKAYQHAPSKLLSPFFFALALSLTRINRISEQVMELLKNATVRCFKDAEISQQSKWIVEMAPQCPDIHQSVMETVENSKYGWDYVIQGLVNFGFLLMDSCGPKAVFGRISEVHIEEHMGSPSSKACELGADILAKTFVAHESVRCEILDQLLNRIVTHASSPITQYVDLLGRTVHAAPQLLLDSMAKIKQVLDYLSCLPSVSARQLLMALLPLLKMSMPLKDSLMLILRKALFSRQLESRKVAVCGFLLFLKHFKVLGNLPSFGSQSTQSSCNSVSFLTQVTADIHSNSSYDSLANEAFCMELLATLRRCLQQQSEIRQMLYTGLLEVVNKNSMLLPAVLSLLYNQLQIYFDSDESVQPPFNLELCVHIQADVAQLKEPIAHLIMVLQLCVKTAQDLGEADSIPDEICDISDKCQQLLNSLCKRIALAELEDFQLDKSSEYNASTATGSKNMKKAQVLLTVYDALIEYIFTFGKFSVDSCQTVIDLYTNRSLLVNVLEEKSSAGKKKDPNASGFVAKKGPAKNACATKVPCLFSTGFLAALLRALFNDSFPNHQESLKLLRLNTKFVAFMLTSCSHKLQQMKDSRMTDSSYDKCFKMLCIMGRSLIKSYEAEILVDHDDDDDVGQLKIASQTIEVFAKIVHIVHLRFDEHFMHFVASISKFTDLNTTVMDDVDNHQLLTTFLTKFQGMVNSIISGDSTSRFKDVTFMVNIISIIQQHMGPPGRAKLYTWVRELCQNNAISDTATLKSLMTLLLNSCRQSHSVSTLVRDMFCDIHSKLCDIIEDIQVEACDNFKVVTAGQIIAISSLLMAHVEILLDDVDWVVCKIKAELTMSSGDKSGRKEEEMAVCIQLGTLITGLHEVVQAALPRGPCFDAVFKCLTHFYNTVTTFIKYNIQKLSSSDPGFCPKLEKLVKLYGLNLTPAIYSLLNYVQNSSDNLPPAKRRKSSDSAAEKAKILKESKAIPPLIYSIEQNERFLIQLSKKSKINFMAHVKLSTARDFRINRETVASAFEVSSCIDDTNNDSSSNSTGVTVVEAADKNESDNDDCDDALSINSSMQSNSSQVSKPSQKRPLSDNTNSSNMQLDEANKSVRSEVKKSQMSQVKSKKEAASKAVFPKPNKSRRTLGMRR